MLENTLILPETDARLAAGLLTSAIDDLTVVLMIVFGKGPEAKQIVEWADQLCRKTRIADDFNLRHVVWIRDPSPASLRAVLDPIIGTGEAPLAIVLNFNDQVKDTLAAGAQVTPTDLELMFARGHQR